MEAFLTGAASHSKSNKPRRSLQRPELLQPPPVTDNVIKK
ncbi:hypothetical protein ACPOL_0567 [Acidisarcina polymorpha]|uniref:Uncharacterized protein n=1 Tax=Acidisarcina polymorpha TaxID=2211140 RepID=A0A2Z5FTA2_9BACT|nr:hypothetical protein ACPOL_0567 [Acidisarcina polymorpha]